MQQRKFKCLQHKHLFLIVLTDAKIGDVDKDKAIHKYLFRLLSQHFLR